MLRVAIIAGVLHTGGKRNLIMEYYRHIDHNKVQFDFICDSDSNGIPEDEIQSLGGKVYIVPPYRNLIPHLKATYRILKDNRYEVMHAFDNTLNIFPMFLGWKAENIHQISPASFFQMVYKLLYGQFDRLRHLAIWGKSLQTR